jgi:hypothetical protein
MLDSRSVAVSQALCMYPGMYMPGICRYIYGSYAASAKPICRPLACTGPMRLPLDRVIDGHSTHLAHL